MSSMNPGGSAGTRVLQDDLNALREDLAQLRQSVASMASEAFGVARENVGGTMDAARRRGQEVAESLEEQMQEHPLATVGIAFGIGLLVGALVRRS